MKKHLIILLACILLSSCSYDYKTGRKKELTEHSATEGIGSDVFYVINIDKCDYVVYSGSQKGSIIHKANCNNHK